MARSSARVALALLVALVAPGCDGSIPGPEDGGPTPDASMTSPDVDAGPGPGPSPVTGEWFEAPRDGAQIFATGHSLIDGVFGPPEHDGGPFSELALAAGKAHRSQLQSGPGSTAWRRHDDIVEGIYAEPDWGSFDTLVLTERADLAGSIVWEQGIREMGWFVDQILGAGPGGDELFLYQTWWGFSDGSAIDLRTWGAWAEYVRAELRLAECTAERLGRQRGVRMRVLPAGHALAELMLAIDAGAADGITPDDIFRDIVHLTDLGHAYLAMVAFGSVYRTPTASMSFPDLPPSRAALFSEMADRVVGAYYDGYEAPTASECRAVMADMCRRAGITWGCNPDEVFGDDLYGAPVGG